MTTIQLPNNWRPRPYQLPVWQYLEHGGRRAVLIAHRRWGKDDVSLHWTATQAVQRVGTYWHLLPEASQARKAVWDAVNPHTGRRRIDEAFPQEIRENTRENEMFIRFKNGSTWQVMGSDNYNSFVGSPPVGVIFSEWALADPSAWSYISPILEENGGYALFITTPRGKNHAFDFYLMAKRSPHWHAEISKADATGVFGTQKLAEIKAELIGLHGEDVGAAMFNQEYLCDFSSPVLGAIFGAEITRAELDGRVCRVPYDPVSPVYAFWDIGFADFTAIFLVQRVALEYRVLGYREYQATVVSDIVADLQKLPYVWGADVLPHDGRNKTLQSDGLSMEDKLAKLGRKPRIGADVSVADGIDDARRIMRSCWFDETNCARGLEVLKNYRYEYNEKNGINQRKPRHDWASHGGDAFRYFAVNLSEMECAGRFSGWDDERPISATIGTLA